MANLASLKAVDELDEKELRWRAQVAVRQLRYPSLRAYILEKMREAVQLAAKRTARAKP
jgi:hypothetical protein